MNAERGTRSAERGTRSGERGGSALIVALWVILILSLLVGTFAYDMHIEAGITSYYRKRLKAEYLARAGVEWAKLILVKSTEQKIKTKDNTDNASDNGEESSYGGAPDALSKGGSVSHTLDLDGGTVTVTIFPTESRRNINKLSETDWEDILDQAGVPQDRWQGLINAFFDWTDANDLNRDPTDETEKDATFYKDRDYKPKNAPLDTVDELLLIKGFSKAIVYGGLLDDENQTPVQGIAQVLTAWGDGRINPNAASARTLQSIGLEEHQIDALLQYRAGPDGIEGTEDDQPFESVDEVMDIGGLTEEHRAQLVIQPAQFHRVVSTATSGTSHPVQRVITCILKLDGKKVTPVYWLEEHMM